MHVVGSLAILHGDIDHACIATRSGDSCTAMLAVDTNTHRLCIALNALARSFGRFCSWFKVLSMGWWLTLPNRVSCFARALVRHWWWLTNTIWRLMVDDFLIGVRLVECFLTITDRSWGLEKLWVYFCNFLHFQLHELQLLSLHIVHFCRSLWSLANLGLNNCLVCVIAVIQSLRNISSLLCVKLIKHLL